ncbi:MAG: DUF1588 domain-containing protein [Rhodospirillaceae bacterium]|nr:DUF1588 domain-containing protein [Rhodospirillaceae bacterium]
MSPVSNLESKSRRRFGAGLRASVASLLTLGVVACSDGGSEHAAPAAKAPATAAVADFGGTPARVRRMSPEQYANTIHYIFGDDVRVVAALTPLPRTDGLQASGAASVGMTIGEIQQLQSSASSIAAQILDKGNPGERIAPRRDYLVPCKPANPAAADDACAAKFIKQTGRLLYRRALPEATVAGLVADAKRGATNLKDFYAGLGSVIEGMLIDPNVLMIADVTEPDPNNPGKRRLDSYSVAARLSFFLWNAGPDEMLLTAAEKGELQTTKGRAKVVAAMMASPRLEHGVRSFFDDMFGFEEFIGLAKDPATYPMVTGQTLIDAREQTLRTVVAHLVTRNEDYRDLFTTRTTFMSPALAPVYQVQPSLGWVPYEFPAGSPRVGLLSQVSFLALHAHPARSSATKRGKALRELLLCQKVPAPPANVDFSAVENPDARLRTARERLNFHSQNPVCAGCHKITDPMGLALEQFDGAGRFRASEKGVQLDVTGTLDGKAFSDVAGLGQALHDHAALPTCLVRRMYSYGTGGPLSRADDPAIKALSSAFAQDGYKVPDLMRMIATSDAFLEVVERVPSPARTAGLTSHSAVEAN